MNALLQVLAQPKDWMAFCRAAKVRGCSAMAHRRWFGKWAGSTRGGVSPIGDEQPWMTYAAAEFLSGWLKKDMSVFEWGSGGSTIFFARHAKQVTAIEHEEAWAVQVRAAIADRIIINAQVEHLPPEPDAAAAGLDAADPSVFASGGEPFRGQSFQRYVTSIDSFPDASFDLVVVDGRARPSCLKRGMTKVKPAGMLLLDNAERRHYQRSRALLDPAQWELHDFTGPGPYCAQFWQTVGWRRKS
ncbi:MAG: hypothetical protein ABIZ56_03325 [Chthoniobacteraceae bacterium]